MRHWVQFASLLLAASALAHAPVRFSETNANSVRIRTNGYNAVGLVTTAWTLQKGVANLFYDANGNPTEARYPFVAGKHPGMTNFYAYDGLNRLISAADKVSTNAVYTNILAYTNFGAFLGALKSEDGPWANDTVGQTYMNRLPSSLSIARSGESWKQTFEFDSLLRLGTIRSPDGSYVYGYSGPGSLVRNLSLPGGLVVSNDFTGFGELKSTMLKDPLQNVLSFHGYDYDGAGYRTNSLRTNAIGHYASLTYGYDLLGQLTNATARESNGTVRLNENLWYVYDKAGNLSARTNDALPQFFTANNLNQVTSISRFSKSTPFGLLSGAATNVKINWPTANTTRYSDSTFARTNTFALTNSGISNTFTVVATDAWGQNRTNSKTVSLPTPITLQWDSNGNLTSDGLRSFEYDGANRLTAVFATNAWRSEFVYDGLSRMRLRKEYQWSGSNWGLTNETRYLHWGRLVVEERNSLNNPVATYTRGVDFSGSWQGAGGIGGLLACTNVNGTGMYHADGMGNITSIVTPQGHLKAWYIYDPFGNMIAQSGPWADINPYRFSSKEIHANSGLYIYGFRFYEPGVQRWTSKDPIGMAGGVNLYGFVGNNPISRIDPLGLEAGYIYNPDGSMTLPNGDAYAKGGEQFWTGLGDVWNFLNPERSPNMQYGVFPDFIGGPGTVGKGLPKLLELLKNLFKKKCPAAAKATPVWPKTAAEMNNFLKVEGKAIPDALTTPGRNKTVWELGPSKITLEQHPYHPNAPTWHKDPHWHLDTPGNPHQRWLPGDPIPGY